MTVPSNSSCLDAETLAAFAEGRLNASQRAAVTAHLDACDECMRDAALAMQAVEEEQANVIRPRRWTPWLAAIAAAVVMALLVPIIGSLRRSPIDRLVAAAPHSTRMVEPRLSGGFAWAPYHGSKRAIETPSSDPARMKLIGVAGELIERTQRDSGAEAQHDAGVAMVLTQNAEEAIPRLEKAAAAAPSATTWNDLAAARYAAASDHGRPALYPQALAACDAALRLDANDPEALFNRALILERMGLADAARAAWTHYLQVDPSSQWAEEARAHLAELPATKASSQFERARPRIEEAALRGDTRSLRDLLADHAARAAALAEAEYLGRWGAAVLQRNDADASRWLTIARAIGEEVAQSRHEFLLRDAVRAIDAISPAQRDAIAAAHVAYRSGRIAYSRQQLGDALADLDRAVPLFTQSRSPMALAARYYVGGIHQAQHDLGAAAELRRVMQDADAQPGYRALRAHVRWELGRAYAFDDDPVRSVATLSDAVRLFREAGDHTNEAFVETILAYGLAVQGRGDESWTWRIESLRALSAEGNPARLAAATGAAMRAELRAGRRDSALALARIPEPVAGNAEQLSLVLDALRFESMLEAQSGNAADALRIAQHAAALAKGVDDASLRARRLADIAVAEGAARAVNDPASAIAPLTRAIDFYRHTDLGFALPEPLLLRARCLLHRGDANAAAHDLEEGMRIVERHRAPDSGIGILDADRALFADAIRLQLDRGDDAAAFAIAERARGASMTIAELRQRLLGSATAVLEIAALRDELVTFAVDGADVRVARQRGDVAKLAALGNACLTESGTSAASALYDALIRPVDGVLAHARHLIVIPDPQLDAIPFAALYDSTSRSRLIERASVATSGSAQSLQRGGDRAVASVATLQLPSGDAAGAVGLPQAGEEVADITPLYRRATAVDAGHATFAALRSALSSADVVHVAGHTERQPGGGEYALLLAGRDGEVLQRVSSRTVAATPLAGAGVLVLAACETLRPPASAETHALSLGAAFAAAGVANVIGTLTPIGDRDARTLFRELHQHFADGESASEALRSTQLSAMREGSAAWRAIALLTNQIDDVDERRRS